MRAELPSREPKILKNWYENKTYESLMEKNSGKPLFILHDGPPYANAKIHIGTALNKILKDFIIRHKNMTGYNAPYVPGYDMHGLPTELKARKDAGLESSEEISTVKLREICREYAYKFADNQKSQFQRLGVIGEWDNPYMTISPDFVAKQIEVFGKIAEKGYIYKGLKPVYWCPSCETALAEAEIEYADDQCFSIYVKFKINDDKNKLSSFGIDINKTFFVIWTTTTWTLPGNVAICLGGNYEYSIIKCENEYLIMADELHETVMQAAKIEEYEIVGKIKGSELELIETQHPFLDRASLIIIGDHVTTESGTGCVHTAPGHGVDDFEVCRKYPQLKMPVPVDAKGVLTEEAGQFAGLSTDESGKIIANHLKETGNLFAVSKITHQYPHCWRCKEGILFRATEQCFCSVKSFAKTAVSEIEKVNWIPKWGEDRIKNMVSDRSDWCLSRQRKWGVPIPIIYCGNCKKMIITDETIKKIADIFRTENADVWYSEDASYFLPDNYKCPDCKSTSFTKETDIMDVWFDSGSSHFSVLEREGLSWPADLYLEGNDQYRGWFQASLLTSVACTGKAPYKSVVSHGWVVDGQGKKMSKSGGNAVAPEEVIDKYGADVLRLWVAGADYQQDIRISDEILKQASESYRKIRNTARFMLGCLSDFDPKKDMAKDEELESIDKFALMQLSDLIKKVHKAYDNFDYYVVCHAIHHFCVVDMSNFYLDVLKERLYVEATNSKTRRTAQTAVYKILKTMTLLISPILSFTSDEIWQFVPQTDEMDNTNIVFNSIPKSEIIEHNEKLYNDFVKIKEIGDKVKKALEEKRAEKIIGAPLDAKVTINCDKDTAAFLKSIDKLKSYYIISDIEINETGNDIIIEKAAGNKCERCWVYSETVGKCVDHPTICARCTDILQNIG